MPTAGKLLPTRSRNYIFTLSFDPQLPPLLRDAARSADWEGSGLGTSPNRRLGEGKTNAREGK